MERTLDSLRARRPVVVLALFALLFGATARGYAQTSMNAGSAAAMPPASCSADGGNRSGALQAPSMASPPGVGRTRLRQLTSRSFIRCGSQLPQATRFWSLTAYTPESIELIPNTGRKYVVASYTKDLQYDEADGSLSIVISATRPPDVPTANWLPVSSRPFNVMLRIYGTASGVKEYVPPAIQSR